MAKIGNANNKKRCERYRQLGRREVNKDAKAVRHKKRMERFAARRYSGDGYVYQKNPYSPGTREYKMEQYERSQKNVSHEVPLQIWTSAMRKVQNQIDADKAAMRAAGSKEGKKVKHENSN